MSDIVFEYTTCSIYAAQGGEPSAEEGYNIWFKEEEEMLFLAFCSLYELEKCMKFYQDSGDNVYIRRQDSEAKR
jgi:hypothetical protein